MGKFAEGLIAALGALIVFGLPRVFGNFDHFLPLVEPRAGVKALETGFAAGLAVALSKAEMSAAFLSDFMEKTSLLVYYQGSLIAAMVLSDTYDAVTQLRTCNASVAGLPDYSDPSLR